MKRRLKLRKFSPADLKSNLLFVIRIQGWETGFSHSVMQRFFLGFSANDFFSFCLCFFQHKGHASSDQKNSKAAEVETDPHWCVYEG